MILCDLYQRLMAISDLSILSVDLLNAYSDSVSEEELNAYKSLEESELTIRTFSFYTSVSAVYSSKIEGEEIELDSYVKHKRFGVEFAPDHTRKVDDLYDAYEFAKENECNKVNILAAHQALTKNILPKHRQGQIRTGNMYVTTSDGKIEYIAPSAYVVENELEKFYADLMNLMTKDLALHEIFFCASFLHLCFVKIHPFDDGNGRTARLIEKWFLAEKLGVKAWLIQSEKYYYLHHQMYYTNIRKLGMEYETLDYSKGLPFLLMLPKSLLTVNE